MPKKDTNKTPLNTGTTLTPVIHESSLSPLEELASPDTYRRVFSYQLPTKHCFFIKADSSKDMSPAVQPNGLVLIKPLDIKLPVKHELIDKQHPRLLNHLSMVAIVVNGKLKIRKVLSSMNTRHQYLNAYVFSSLPQNGKLNTNLIIPEANNPVRVIGKVIEVINRY